MATAKGPAPKRRRRPPPPASAPETTDAPQGKGAKDVAPQVPPAGEPPPLFAGAKHQEGFPKMPSMRRGFQTVVDDLFESEGYDVKAEWEAVRAGIEIKDALTPQRLKLAANEQEALADRAHQLYIVAKIEVDAYMRETEATHGAVREAAVQSLEQQKANKTRTKMITDADVTAEAARLYPDEWADTCTRREKAKAMLAHIQNLAALAKSRCYTVSNMMAPGNRGV